MHDQVRLHLAERDCLDVNMVCFTFWALVADHCNDGLLSCVASASSLHQHGLERSIMGRDIDFSVCWQQSKAMQ